jgi:hypothetical protein
MSIKEATFKDLEKLNEWEKLLKTLLGGEQPKMNNIITIKLYVDKLKCNKLK